MTDPAGGPATGAPGADPAGTAALRNRVLDAWAASPARFREDANAEDDLVSGGYRDRVVVELAANAVDAADRAGVPARLVLRLADGVLRAANTGAPLDEAGVEALATLRASAKRDGGSVGRFGVGFAAVLAVTDSPAVVSRGLAVGWSRAATLAAARGVPALAAELEARGDHVPVLRLPFPAAGEPPPGADTEVVLPLRDAAAEALARRLLADVDAALLLALPGLAEVVVEVDGATRRLTATRSDGDVVVADTGTPGGPAGATTRWRTAGDAGDVPPGLLADRPVEERRRGRWAVTWAVPVDDEGRLAPLPPGLDRVVHAPTPSDDPLSLPALLVATFPLDPSRRHVATGPLTAWLARRAGTVLARLAAALAPEPGLLALVPTGFGAGPVDAQVRAAAQEALADAPLLPPVDGRGRLPGRDAAVLDAATPRLAALLGEAVPGLLGAAWAEPPAAARLAVLGVRRLGLAEAVDALAGLARPPAWWRELYTALDAVARRPEDTEGLGALPVPLADGRLAPGPRGLVLAGGGPAGDGHGLPWGGLAALGLRVVSPEAAAPLLLRLGAVEASPAALLADPAVRAAVEASVDDADAGDDPAPLAETVLRLVAATGLTVADSPWLADLALTDDTGEPAPAGELLLPGSPLAAVVDPDGPLRPVAGSLVDTHGADALTAVGVLATFAVARAVDVVLDGPPGLDVDGEQSWVEEVLARAGGDADLPPSADEVTAVRDLDLVRPDAWPAALPLLAGPGLREHVVEPLLVRPERGAPVRVPSYTAWWLSREPVLAGRRPRDLRLPDADRALHGLLDPVPAEAGDLDAVFLRALGCRGSLADLLADPAGREDLLARLADPGRPVDRAGLRAVYAALPGAFAGADLLALPWPERLRAVRGGAVEVVDADDVLVVDRPDLLGLLGRRAVLPAALDATEALAWTLDVERASEAAAYDVVSRPGRVLAWADVPGAALAARRLGAPGPPTAVVAVHRGLVVTDVDGAARPATWRAVADVDHVDAAAGSDALGRALAWRLGAWGRRAAAVEALRAGDAAAEAARLEAEDDLDG